MSWSQFFAICAGCFIGNIIGRITVFIWEKHHDNSKSKTAVKYRIQKG